MGVGGGSCITVGLPPAKDPIMSSDHLNNSTLKEAPFKDLFLKKGTHFQRPAVGDACSLGFVVVVFGVRPEDRVEKSRNSFSRSLYLPKKGLSALRTLQGLTLCGKMYFRLFYLLSHLRSGCSCWRCYT